jgi:hypothetical protein
LYFGGVYDTWAPGGVDAQACLSLSSRHQHTQCQSLSSSFSSSAGVGDTTDTQSGIESAI